MVDVQVNVLRNLNKPVFRQNLYEVEVDERTAYGTVVLNVTADDIDFIDQPGVSTVITSSDCFVFAKIKNAFL